MNKIPLRVDAERNRERILAAAEEVFLKHGVATSLDDVAKRAKVGIGILYRRFPTRDALLAAICDERLMGIAEASRLRKSVSDPVSALRSFMEELAIASNLYRGLAAMFGIILEHPTSGCKAATKEGQRLLRRGQAAGVLRLDISVADVVCVITAASLASAERSHLQRTTHLIGLFLDGARTRN